MKVTKWSTLAGDLTVSEQKPEQTSGEPSSVGVGPADSNSSDAQSEPVAASMQESVQGPMQEAIKESTDIDSPKLVPAQAGPDKTPEVGALKADAQESDAPKPDA